MMNKQFENKEAIRVLLLEPDKRARIVTIQGDDSSLRQALGGDFEPIHSLSEECMRLGKNGCPSGANACKSHSSGAGRVP